MDKSSKVETVGNILDIPSCIADRNHTRADLTFEPPESRDKVTIQYHYDQEKDDREEFELLVVDSPEQGVYARFMVIRSDSNKKPHILNFSSFIPQSMCKIEKVDHKPKKKKDQYEVVLRKTSKSDVNIKECFTPKRPSTSSSDEEKV